MKTIFTVLLLTVLVLSACDCIYEVSGVVLDEKTLLPVGNVAIGKTDTTDLDNPFNKKTFTGDSGVFEVNGIAGSCDEVTLYFTKKGYVTNKLTFENHATDTVYLKKEKIPPFDPLSDFELTELMQTNDYPSSQTDTTICASWSLSKADIKKIIRTSEPINGPDWHHMFDHLPCRIIGVIKQGEYTYGLSLNAGAWFTVHSTDTAWMYGNFQKENDSYFLSPVWREEDEEREK